MYIFSPAHTICNQFIDHCQIRVRKFCGLMCYVSIPKYLKGN